MIASSHQYEHAGTSNEGLPELVKKLKELSWSILDEPFIIDLKNNKSAFGMLISGGSHFKPHSPRITDNLAVI